jgi:thiamine pyridinylase
MTNDALKNIRFRLMPFSDKKDVHLFYSDIVGINPAVKDKQMRAAAVKLANLMASKEVMVGSILSTSKQQQFQYLLPVRHSVFKTLAKKDPLRYTKSCISS